MWSHIREGSAGPAVAEDYGGQAGVGEREAVAQQRDPTEDAARTAVSARGYNGPRFNIASTKAVVVVGDDGERKVRKPERRDTPIRRGAIPPYNRRGETTRRPGAATALLCGCFYTTCGVISTTEGRGER